MLTVHLHVPKQAHAQTYMTIDIDSTELRQGKYKNTPSNTCIKASSEIHFQGFDHVPPMLNAASSCPRACLSSWS